MAKWEENVRKVVPYVPGEQPVGKKMVKLNTNENPYPPSPNVAKVLRELNADNLRLYPDPTAKILVDELSDHYGVAPDQIFVGVGSDDVLAMAFLTFFNGTKPILFPDITYSFYDVWANLYGIAYECPLLDDAFEIKKEDYMRENGGIILPNPNAPTGICQGLDEIKEILDHNLDVVVIIDEAYIDFGGISVLSLIDAYDNLLVVQTFSKSRSLAGMRIGYAFAQPKLIKYLNDVKYSFNSYTMDQTALHMGVAAIKDTAYFEKTVGKIIHTRAWVKKELAALGFTFGDSKGNFIFAAHPVYKAELLFEALKAEEIYVRYFKRPRIDNYLRITIGTDEEMQTLLAFLKNYMK
ncbi:histidinol-phosphate transaminase [Lachnospiraceae bacterium ZAX-1]